MTQGSIPISSALIHANDKPIRVAIPVQNNSDKSVLKQLRLATISEDERFPLRNSGVAAEVAAPVQRR